MNEVAFVSQKEPNWRRLHQLCDKADASPKNLTTVELRELIKLYRTASSDLAMVRTHTGNLQLIDFLNDLVGRSYMTLYRPIRPGVFRSITQGIVEFAQVAVRRKWFVFAATAIFFAGAAFSAGLLKMRPDLRSYVVPRGMERNFKEWTDGSHEARTVDEAFMATGFYASNNPFVSILTGGIAVATLGVGTAQLMWSNGVMLGALGSDMQNVGKLGFLLSSIAPHGVTEIQGIFIAGGAGLLLGWTVIFPGQRRRGDALRVAGKDAIVLLAGGVVMMFIAAPFEGFFSFNPTFPQWLKAVVAGVIAIGWTVFYVGLGRSAPEAKAGNVIA